MLEVCPGRGFVVVGRICWPVERSSGGLIVGGLVGGGFVVDDLTLVCTDGPAVRLGGGPLVVGWIWEPSECTDAVPEFFLLNPGLPIVFGLLCSPIFLFLFLPPCFFFLSLHFPFG